MTKSFTKNTKNNFFGPLSASLVHFWENQNFPQNSAYTRFFLIVQCHCAQFFKKLMSRFRATLVLSMYARTNGQV